jgi:hypothetical protein
MYENYEDTVLNIEDFDDNSGISDNDDIQVQAAVDEPTNANQQISDAEKTNAIVKQRTKRYLKQNEALKGELAAAKSDAEKYRMIQNALKSTGIESPEAQASALAEYFGVSKDTFLTSVAPVKEQSKGDAYVDARHFLDSASDDEVIAEVEHLLEKRNNSPQSFSTADNVRLTELNNAYSRIRYQRDVSVAEKFCSENGLDFNNLVNDTDFIDFAKDLNVPISTAVKKYARFTKAKEPAKTQPASTGSVKDNSGITEKEYYSPEEVDKLTSAQLDNPKIWEAVRKSMTKWNK